MTNRAELKKLWHRSKTDSKFRNLLYVMLSSLVWVSSTAKDRLAACELADFTLRKAGARGRRELRRLLKDAGWEI